MKNTSFLSSNNSVLGIIAALILTATIGSCSKDQAEPKKEEPKVDKVTYENFAGALFQSKCSGCHATGGMGAGKWVFSGYNSVKEHATRINNAVLVIGSMPQGGSLSATEKEKLKKWFDSGLSEK